MTLRSHTIVVAMGGLVLTAASFAAAFFAQPLLLAIPLGLVAVLLLVQHPGALHYLLLASIPWSAEVNITASIGTDLPDEPLMLLLAFVVLLLLLAQRRQKVQWQSPSPLLLLLALGFCWSVVSTAASTHVLLSVKYLLAKGWYLLAFVGAPLLLGGDKKLVGRSAVALLLSMLLVTCIGLVRHAGYGFSFAQVNESLAPFFRNHVNYSALLAFMVPVQLVLYKLTASRRCRFWIGVSLVVVLAALGLSYARGAWLALVAGLLSFWLLKKGWLVKAFLLSLLLAAGAVYWLQQDDRYLRFAPHHDTTIFHENFGEHLLATYKGKDVSTAERFYRWVAGARMAEERWLTGFGPTTFNQHYREYAVPAFRTWVSANREQSTVHNYFLLLLLEQGVAGLLVFLLLLGAAFWQAQAIYRRTDDPFWKATVAAIAAILCMQCTVNFLSDLIETDKVGSVFYLCIAFLVIAERSTRMKANGTNQRA